MTPHQCVVWIIGYFVFWGHIKIQQNAYICKLWYHAQIMRSVPMANFPLPPYEEQMTTKDKAMTTIMDLKLQ